MMGMCHMCRVAAIKETHKLPPYHLHRMCSPSFICIGRLCAPPDVSGALEMFERGEEKIQFARVGTFLCRPPIKCAIYWAKALPRSSYMAEARPIYAAPLRTLAVHSRAKIAGFGENRHQCSPPCEWKVNEMSEHFSRFYLQAIKLPAQTTHTHTGAEFNECDWSGARLLHPQVCNAHNMSADCPSAGAGGARRGNEAAATRADRSKTPATAIKSRTHIYWWAAINYNE